MISPSPSRFMLPEISPQRALSDELHHHYATILRNVLLPDPHCEQTLRAIGVTSCRRGSGASTVALHLAATAAANNVGRVLLVDANLAWPAVYRKTGLPAGPGLTEMMLDELPWNQVVQAGPVPHLSVLTAGACTHDEAAVFDAPELADLVASLKESFDLVIFDLPHTNETSGAFRLARLLEGVLLVIEAEQVRLQDAQRSKTLLQRAHVHVLGAVLNKFSSHLPKWLERRR